MGQDTQFVRVKNIHNQTYFLTTSPQDPAIYMKTCVAQITKKPIEEMRLQLGNRQLDDECSLYDQQVVNDSIVTVLFKNPKGEWEEIAQDEDPTVQI